MPPSWLESPPPQGMRRFQGQNIDGEAFAIDVGPTKIRFAHQGGGWRVMIRTATEGTVHDYETLIAQTRYLAEVGCDHAQALGFLFDIPLMHSEYVFLAAAFEVGLGLARKT